MRKTLDNLVGKRIELVEMGADEPNPIETGTRGTVVYVDDIGTIHVNWDNGRSLGLVPGQDRYRIINERDITKEEIELAEKIVESKLNNSIIEVILKNGTETGGIVQNYDSNLEYIELANGAGDFFKVRFLDIDQVYHI